MLTVKREEEGRANQKQEQRHLKKNNQTNKRKESGNKRATHTMSMALAITSRSWLSKRFTLGTSRMRR